MSVLLDELHATSIEAHRLELTGFCYRMVASAFVAEDAVQETLLLASLHHDRFRAQRRTWLYRIATSVCLDVLRGAAPRVLPTAGGLVPGQLVLPVPDDHVQDAGGDPTTLRLPYVAALQQVPPRQRAALLLRDVAGLSVAEVADVLDTTTSGAASTLARARAALAAAAPAATEPLRPDDPVQQDLLVRYRRAVEQDDVTALVALLHDDVVVAMPPHEWSVRGVAAAREVLVAARRPGRVTRLVPTVANGSPAFWLTTAARRGGVYEPEALVVLETAGGRITAITTFLDGPRLLTLFAYG
ncbi:RNA polymerase subunit sigma-70 [Pseudonocardia sp. CA-107938]|uniref:RNA polymerase subunit sigma-70 n=1 Tax=Pseudonocardia sp. CA-107938 TaxID=3240021 RepID=UPI003D8FFFFF